MAQTNYGAMGVVQVEGSKVKIAEAAKPAQQNHVFEPGRGYIPVPYEYQDFPKMLYKPRKAAESLTAELLGSLFQVEGEARQDAYIRVLEQLGQAGHDIRQFPLSCPDNPSLKSLRSVISLQSASQYRQEWLAAHPDKNAADYKAFMAAPESAIASNAQDVAALGEGWFYDPGCKASVGGEVPEQAKEETKPRKK